MEDFKVYQASGTINKFVEDATNGQPEIPDSGFIKQPSDFIGVLGQTSWFTVKAVGYSTIQWQYSNDNGLSWLNSGLAGNGTDKFHPDITTGRLAYIYRCRLVSSIDSSYIYSRTVRMLLAN